MAARDKLKLRKQAKTATDENIAMRQEREPDSVAKKSIVVQTHITIVKKKLQTLVFASI